MPPARQRCFGPSIAAAPFLADREPHPGRDLLGPPEIFMRRFFEGVAVERHEPW